MAKDHGQKILIRFAQPLANNIKDLLGGNEAAFNVYGQEKRNDSIIQRQYTIKKIELYEPEIFLSVNINCSSAIKINAKTENNSIKIDNGTKAEFISSSYSISDNGLDGLLQISWDEDKPEGTDIKAYISVNKGSTYTRWNPIKNGAPFNFSEHQLCNLWFMFILISESGIETPSISNIRISEIDHNNSIVLITDEYSKFHNVIGDISIIYSSSKGTLMFRGAKVPSFATSFTPTDLIPSPLIKEEEHIFVNIDAAGNLLNIYYTDIQTENNIEISNVSATGTGKTSFNIISERSLPLQACEGR